MVLLVVIAGTSAFLSLFFLPRTTDKYARWITIGLAVTTGFSLLPNPVLAYDGYVAHAIALFIASIYVFFPRDEEFSLTKKVFLLVVLLLPLLSMILEMYEPPGIPQMGFLCSAGVACYAYIFMSQKQEYQNELGMLTVAAGDGFLRLGLGIIAVGNW